MSKEKKNKVFIATSMDGFIADRNGGIDWLDTIPEINSVDTGYMAFTAEIDALVMGRRTFDTVCGFDIEWPYKKPVFVVSRTMTEITDPYKDKAQLVHGTIPEILEKIHGQGHYRLYIDGGQLVQSFLKEDLIDEFIITIIPVLLGGGHPLFSDLEITLDFECIETKHFLGKVVQNHFRRIRK